MTTTPPQCPTPEPVALSPRRWQYASTAIFTTAGFAISTWFSRIATVRDNLHASTAQMSVLLLALAVGSIVGLTAAPQVISRMGARRGLFMAVSVLSTGLCLTGLTTDRWANLTAASLALVIFGLGNGSIDVMMNVEGSQAERAVGQTKLPLMHGFFSIGTIFGAAVGAFCAVSGVGVSFHMAAMAIVVLSAGCAAVHQLPADVADRARATARTPSVHAIDGTGRWFDLRLLVIGILIAGTTFAEGAGNDWISLAAVDGHHLPNSGGSYIYGCFVLAMTTGRLAGGRLLDGLGRARVLAVMATMAIAGVVMLILTNDTALVVVGTLLWGGGISLGFPTSVSAAADHPTHSARRVSIVSVFGYSAFLVGPPVIGFIGQRSGLLSALWLVVGALGMALACTPALRERVRWRQTAVTGKVE